MSHVTCLNNKCGWSYKLSHSGFVVGQNLATNQFVASLLQPTTCQLIRLSTCTLVT